MTVKAAIKSISELRDLDESLARQAIAEIMSGEATDAQIAGFLMGLKLKGEKPHEIAAMAQAMMDHAVTIAAPGPCIDTCGTGGDGQSTFNISTAVAFVCAGAGVHVAKHGNRSVSSTSGSADVLEALGARIDVDPLLSQRILSEIGIAFLFAPIYHPGMRHAASARRELGVRTVFNILGPLLNPARAPYRCVGVATREHLELVAGTFERLGVERALVYHSEDGLDEISLEKETAVIELRHGTKSSYTLTAADFGMKAVPVERIRAHDPAESARLLYDALSGVRGPAFDYVVANAAAALYLAGVVGSYRGGAERARAAIDSGAALEKLQNFIEMTGGSCEFPR